MKFLIIFLFLPWLEYGYNKNLIPSPTPNIKHRTDEFLDLLPKNGFVIEVGVQEGIFSEYILQRTQPKQLVLIDCWEKQPQNVYNDPANVSNQEQIRKFKRVCRKFSHLSQIKIIKNFSSLASYQFTDNSVDWIYLDANHSYAAVKEDIKNWWPKIKKGGFLTGHDYVLTLRNFLQFSF
jgi:hypothetical protein